CRSSLTTGFWRELCRCAVPSAFVAAIRAASDAFPTRHCLSRRPAAHPAVTPTSAQFCTPERQKNGVNMYDFIRHYTALS
ncbi:hypothetical protein WCU94_17885, partial [Pectobacterium carotovorum]